MPFRDALQPMATEPDRWALQQYALLQVAMSKQDKATLQTALDVIQPGYFIHVWREPQQDSPPGWAIASRGGELLVVIRGTTNLQQWVAHVIGGWGMRDPNDPAGYVHIGMWGMATNFILPGVRDVLA